MFLLFCNCFVDTVSSTIQSTVDTTSRVAQSAIDTGKTYATTARGRFHTQYAIINIIIPWFIFILLSFTFICVFLDSVANTVNSTVENTKHAAQSAVDTTKTYVDSAKGILYFYFLFFCRFFCGL